VEQARRPRGARVEPVGLRDRIGQARDPDGMFEAMLLREVRAHPGRELRVGQGLPPPVSTKSSRRK